MIEDSIVGVIMTNVNSLGISNNNLPVPVTEPKLNNKKVVAFKAADGRDQFVRQPQMMSPQDAALYKAIEEQQKREKNQKLKQNLSWGVGIASGLAIIGFLALQMKAMKGGGVDAADKALHDVKIKFKDMAQSGLRKLKDNDSMNPKLKKELEAIINDFNCSPEVYKYASLHGEVPAKMFVLYGVPGTGKTYAGETLAKSLDAYYAKVQFSDIASPYIGSSSVKITNVFKTIREKAMQEPNKKFVFSFDEIDSLISSVKGTDNNQHIIQNRTSFLNGLDSIKDLKNVIIVGTTNVNPAKGGLDKATLSRFGKTIEVGLPTVDEILASLKYHLGSSEAITSHKFIENHEKELKELAEEMYKQKYSQRDVLKLAEESMEKFRVKLPGNNNFKAEEFSIDYLKECMKNKGVVTGNIGEGTTSVTDKESYIVDLIRALSGKN